MNTLTKILATLLLTTGLFAATHTAKVIDTLSSGGYSYINVQEGNESYWIAMTQRAVTKGTTITYNEQGWMQDFHSKTLNRTFDKILFASDASASSAVERVPSKPDVMGSKYQQKSTITIAELFSNRDKYVGKKVRIRGMVTKRSAQIMKKNWVHIQDGSSFKDQDDLVFTTDAKMPKKDSVVVAEGLVRIDKDFGYGYFYPVIVEESTFSIE
ncbi:MAG: hypothetical protein PF439_05195 [Helicobacteraceae bacterium]|jgi:hypothetical protein|nr:hypothetical protein [Helicobacteraceae bacterium]